MNIGKLIENFEAFISKMPHESIFIGDDMCLVQHTFDEFEKHEPAKINKAVIIICLSGSCRININLKEYDIESPMIVTLMPGQIFEPIERSANFESYSIALSKRFLDMINVPGWQQRFLSMYNNPTTKLDGEQLMATRIFFSILHRAASDTDNPFRLQVVENLIRAFYYGGLGSTEKPSTGSTYKNGIVERFLDLVRENYHKERMIGYYADRMCITPKYLSKIIKEHTGRSAGEWIESHVILEARAMLQSSDMTIQQIAASLNFPNQSFFGKYFKRATGLSPKEYRRTGGK